MASQLKAELISITVSHWNDHESPILLSALGGKLSTDAKAERASDGRPLAAFIVSELSSEIRIIPASGRGGAAAPADKVAEKSDEEIESLLQPTTQKNSNDRSIKRHPIIWPELWALFRDGVDPDIRTFVEFKDSGGVLIHRVSGGSPIDSSWVRVEPGDIAQSDMANGRRSPFAIGTSVRDWAYENNIPVARTQDGFSRQPVGRTQRNDGEPNALMRFAEGLDILPAEDLTRIQLPADIVVRLIRRSL